MNVGCAVLTATEAAQRAVLDAALDCVIRIDDRGRVTYFNESAERTFGYGADEAVGQELADVILPPSYRDAHRRGLARYLETGAANILDRRIELTAIRRDGTEFPVELTVTSIESSNGPGFIGFLRDITARVSATEALQAARDRTESIANEQAALRRVATLVARHTTPGELFELVAKEAANLLGVRFISIMRATTRKAASPWSACRGKRRRLSSALRGRSPRPLPPGRSGAATNLRAWMLRASTGLSPRRC